jgi:hypothetical protein
MRAESKRNNRKEKSRKKINKKSIYHCGNITREHKMSQNRD